jgi:hypothetical protein
MAAFCERGNEHSGSVQCEGGTGWLAEAMFVCTGAITCMQLAITATLSYARSVVAALFRELERDVTH